MRTAVRATVGGTPGGEGGGGGHRKRAAVSLTVTQAYRFALDPTPAQEREVLRHAGAARVAFNWAWPGSRPSWTSARPNAPTASQTRS
ncbi:helix-turn-helix domain-containing protein [Micromonospora sp. L31]|uniref:helix-turn-helix domain-containing protein n=1 Tax=Micromonospora sp. L31 TaxID=3452213 RepID=UPI003F8A0031